MENGLTRGLIRWLGWATLGCFAISAVLVSLLLVGYGNLQIDLPAGTSVSINGHAAAQRHLRLRTGNYQLVVTSPYYDLRDDTVSVGLFRTATYKPSLQPRDTSSILTSTILTDGGRGKPQFSQLQWFNNTWVAGQLKLSGQFIALSYSNERWHVAYYLGQPGYPTNPSSLPGAVSSYISTQEAAYAAQPD